VTDEERIERIRSPIEQRVALLIRELDRLDIDSRGGYPSDWIVESGTVYRATTIDGRPHLEITPVTDFIAETEALLKELRDEEEDDA
jgi:hypothetical protein